MELLLPAAVLPKGTASHLPQDGAGTVAQRVVREPQRLCWYGHSVSEETAARVASGANYTLDVDRGVVCLRVWKNSQLTFAQGAQLAHEKLSHLRVCVERPGMRALLFDLEHAPPVVGPVTEAAVQAMIRLFCERHLPVAVLVGDSPLQALQFARLLREMMGPAHDTHGLVTSVRAQAEAFVRGAPTSRRL